MTTKIVFKADLRTIELTYLKRKRKTKEQAYEMMILRNVCQELPNLYELKIDKKYVFKLFPCLNEFFYYVKRSKKKDIIDVKDDKIISFMIITSQGSFQTQTFQLQSQEKSQQKSPTNQQNMMPQSEVKPVKIKKIDRRFKSVQKQYFTFTTPDSDVQNQIDEQNTSKVFQIDLSQWINAGFKFKAIDLKCDNVYVGVSMEMQNTKRSRMCKFGRFFNSSFQIEQGHLIEIFIEDYQLLIRNTNNIDGKKFESFIPLDYTIPTINFSIKIFIGLRQPTANDI